MSGMALVWAVFVGMGMSAVEASAYNCRDSCRDQCWVTTFGVRNVNPACHAACQSWKHVNCHNLNPGVSACGEVGAQAYVGASNVMFNRSVGKKRRYLSFEERTILSSMYSKEILKRTQLHFGVPPLDKIGGGSVTINLGSVAQTYGYHIYFKDRMHVAMRGNLSWIQLLAHELKHVEQYVNRGRSLKRFGRDYFEGYCKKGFRYNRIPMEKEAHAIEGRAGELARTFYGNGGLSSSDNRVSLTCIKNRTDFTVNYKIRWGTSGNWSSMKVKPGKWRSHFWKYTFANENRSPKLYVKFDWDLRANGSQYKEYWVKRWAVPSTNCNDLKRWEEFKYTDNKRKINLYKNH